MTRARPRAFAFRLSSFDHTQLGVVTFRHLQLLKTLTAVHGESVRETLNAWEKRLTCERNVERVRSRGRPFSDDELAVITYELHWHFCMSRQEPFSSVRLSSVGAAASCHRQKHWTGDLAKQLWQVPAEKKPGDSARPRWVKDMSHLYAKWTVHGHHAFVKVTSLIFTLEATVKSNCTEYHSPNCMSRMHQQQLQNGFRRVRWGRG